MRKIKFKVTVTMEKIFELDRELYPVEWTDEDILEHEVQHAEEGYFVEWDDAQITVSAEMIDQAPAGE